MNKMANKRLRILRSSALQHVLFWGISFFILLHVFSLTETITKLDYIYTLLFHLGLVVGVYLNMLFLIPYFLKKEKYILYGVLLIGDIILSTEAILLVFNHLSDLLFPGYYIVSGYSFFDMAKFQLIYIGLTTLLELSSAWFRLAESEKKLIQTEQEKVSVELQVLKSQINPHFLFNSLNNLYSLTLKKSDRAPDMILRLSSLMRYILYESSVELVSLRKEIDCIIDYIEIQNLRIEESDPEIDFDLRGEVGDKQIAPLIFLPLVENAFKHGMKGAIDSRFIKLVLDVNNEQIFFTIKNNKGKAVKVKNEMKGGIGLENIKKRLNLIYPNRHTIKITDSFQVFEVELKILLN